MATLLVILRLLPSIIGAVKAAEDFIPIPAQGKAKLDFVLGVVTDVDAEASNLVPQIAAVVGRIVALANLTGVFKKSA
jgi:hypothetical protein